MRYYCTDKKGQVVEKSSTTIIDSDIRVSNFFEPTPYGYIKAYNIDGLPFNELIQIHTPTQEEIEERAKTYFTSEIQKHIDDARIIFNTSNNVAFESLANIDSASNRVGYSLQAQCEVFVDWAYVAVWDTMRTWQSTLTALPTEVEFRAKLATVAYNG